MIKETRYAKVLAEAATADQDGHQAKAERLIIKKKGIEALRFSWWHQRRFMPRPLDMEESGWIELFREAIKEGVFTQEFIKNLKSILS
jgi:hypothetical protein